MNNMSLQAKLNNSKETKTESTKTEILTSNILIILILPFVPVNLQEHRWLALLFQQPWPPLALSFLDQIAYGPWGNNCFALLQTARPIELEPEKMLHPQEKACVK